MLAGKIYVEESEKNTGKMQYNKMHFQSEVEYGQYAFSLKLGAFFLPFLNILCPNII